MKTSGPQYFFKVFFPQHSLNSMMIPPAFCKHIQSESGNKISVTDPNGDVWKIKLIRSSKDEFMFEDGWNKFAIDHNLVMGDFLLFCYDGKSRFRVLLFDSTCCEKTIAANTESNNEDD